MFKNSLLFLSTKDFGASERGQKPLQLGKGQPVSSRDQQGNPEVRVWEEDDVDSVKVHFTHSHLNLLNFGNKFFVIQ